MSPSPVPRTLPSERRPIPLAARRDLIATRVDNQGIGSYVVKDPVGLKYHRLENEQHRALELLDGRRSLEDLRRDLTRHFPTANYSPADLQYLITDLYRKGLLVSLRPGQAAPLLERQRGDRRRRFWGALRNILFLRLPGWDPHVALRMLLPLVSWAFRPWAVAAAVLLVLAAWTLLLVQFAEFHRRLPEFQQFFGWPNLLWLWVTLAGCKLLHEFGHGLTCARFGGECHEMGIMLLVFSPTLYCDVTDSWMMPSKWRRIAIAAAGMSVEIVLSAVALFVWWWTSPGTLHHLVLNVFFVTTVTTVIFNLNPLMRLDGYYMLSDFLEIPNLRTKSDRLLRTLFARHCLGIELPPDPFAPERRRAWFVLYSVAAAAYRWALLLTICLFLYTMLKPYGLQSIGVALAVLSLAAAVAGLIVSIYRILTTPRRVPMNRRRLAVTLTVLAALAAAGLALPLPLHIEAAFLVQPEGVRHVYTSVPGRLDEILVRPGDRVEAGQPLAVLSSDELEDEAQALLTDIGRQERTVDRFLHQEDRVQEHLAAQRLDRLREQLADVEERRAQLVVRAPCAGTVVGPPRIPEPKFDPADRGLVTWHGTPLDPENAGAWLEPRTHIASIAPSERLEAVLVIDQADRNDLADGQPVELKLEHLPARTYDGIVASISRLNLEFAPEALSNKLGGPLPTVTDAEGRERLTGSAYQATVLLEEDARLLVPGLRGTARFRVAKRSAGQWLWRWLRQTFHFRL